MSYKIFFQSEMFHRYFFEFFLVLINFFIIDYSSANLANDVYQIMSNLYNLATPSLSNTNILKDFPSLQPFRSNQRRTQSRRRGHFECHFWTIAGDATYWLLCSPERYCQHVVRQCRSSHIFSTAWNELCLDIRHVPMMMLLS